VPQLSSSLSAPCTLLQMPPIYVSLYPLSTFSSHALALLFSSSYVGSLYLAKNARIRFTEPDVRHQVQPGSRDDPAVIRARLTVVTIASTFTCGVVYFLLSRFAVRRHDFFFSFATHNVSSPAILSRQHWNYSASVSQPVSSRAYRRRCCSSAHCTPAISRHPSQDKQTIRSSAISSTSSVPG
jgi:hypothetical protein